MYQHNKNGGKMEKKISIESALGKVCGTLVEFNKTSIAIICHGLTSSKDSRTGKALKDHLAKERLSSLSIDLYAHGESDGKMQELTISKAVESVIAAYNYLKSQGYQKISLAGSSFSGIVCLIAATKLEIESMVLKCPVFDYVKLLKSRLDDKDLEKWKKDGKRKQFDVFLGYELYEDVLSYDIIKIATRVNCPTLFIHGSGDKLVPPEHSENAYRLISSKEKELHIVNGADHFFIHEKHFNEVIDASYAWLLKYMK